MLIYNKNSSRSISWPMSSKLWYLFSIFELNQLNLELLPIHISVLFGLITFLAIALFYKASNNSKATIVILLIWLALQAIIGLSGFYTITDTFPPRFLFLILPPFLFIIILFFSYRGRQYIDSLDLKKLMILHIIRVPVEIVLFWLFVHKVVPEIMTVEGRNFDILSGVTAPIILYFGFIRKKLDRNILLFWNIICLGLLINIIANGILSAPFPFQKFAFEQPNIAVLYFPFNWLPSCIVPLVLLSHLVAIRQLINSYQKKKNTV